MNKKNNDPRESLADALTKAGVDSQVAFLIALDAGRNLVDAEYLRDLGLIDDQLIFVEQCVKDFYWSDHDNMRE